MRLAGLAMAAVLIAGPVAADTDTQTYFQFQKGKADYERYCAACHGLDAKGVGPVARFLITRPPDLTTLAVRNEGVFPTDRVFWVIDGRGEVAAHGPREMPIWGYEFGTDDRGRIDEDARTRIKDIIGYLDSLQVDEIEEDATPTGPAE